MLTELEVYKLGKQEDWTEVESNHSRSGALPSPVGINSNVYLAQIVECDARKAEALVLENPADPLLVIRSLLFRGRLSEAKSFINILKSDLKKDQTQLAKVLTEEARLAAFRGEWQSCLSFCEEVFALELPPITRLTILQIGALARFELGDFARAKLNLNLVDSLARLFPKSISVFYAELLKIRIEAREQSPPWALQRLEKQWMEWLKNDGDIDQLQALLRVEVDIRRVARRSHFSYACGSYIAAEIMGEDLYVGLAILDCFLSASEKDRDAFGPLVQQMAKTYVRVDSILKELTTETMRSTSVQAMYDHEHASGISKSPSCNIPVGAFPQLTAAAMIFPQYEILVRMKPFHAISLANHKQFNRVFKAIGSGPINKSELFKTVWGQQKYSSALHDGLIYTLLYRLKKICDVKIVIKDGLVCLENALVIF